jgi:hypothetical protein
MIKFVIAAIWIAAATVGSVYYSFNRAQSTASGEAPPPFFGGLDYLNTEIISVPLLRNGQVYGYFLGRLVYTVDPEELQKLSIPAEALVTDQTYAYLYANPQIDFLKRSTIDLDAIRNGIRDSINERIGHKLVHDVLIQQLDFLTKEDVRDNTVRRRISAIDSAIRMEEAAPPEAEGAH